MKAKIVEVHAQSLTMNMAHQSEIMAVGEATEITIRGLCSLFHDSGD